MQECLERNACLDEKVNNTNSFMPIVRYKGTMLPEFYVSILGLIGEGYSNIEIAKEMDLSKRTIEGAIAKIRDMIAKLNGERLTERKLVIFAREMLDGYEAYTKLKEEKNSHLSKVKLIEDWDEEDIDEEFEDFTGLEDELEEPQSKPQPGDKVVDLRQYRQEYEITDFEAEERELVYHDGTHYLL